jgi:hypothetical protein
MSNPPGTKIRLRVKSQGKFRELTIKLKNLI